MTEPTSNERKSGHPAKATTFLLIGTVVLVVLLAAFSTFR
jgi:hypothetical protein